MTAYIALIRKQPDSDYGVEFPDFPGCITAGKSLEEARRMASEALNFHIAGMVEDRETIPHPSALDEIMADPHHAQAMAVLVDVAARRAAVRVNVSLPEDLLEAIDRVSDNRSRFLADAAREKLQHT
jgi:predicted RNase H-like HicB family nuclease